MNRINEDILHFRHVYSKYKRAMTANPDGGLLISRPRVVLGITPNGDMYNYTKLCTGFSSKLPCDLGELTIQEPFAIHANHSRVLIFDHFRAHLISVNKSGRCERFAGYGWGLPRDGPRLFCCLEDIRSIIQDIKGTYYMTEVRNCKIRALSTSGYVTTIATLPFSNPPSICIRPWSSDILVASRQSDCIVVVNPKTRKQSTLQFSQFQGPPTGLCALSNGSILITEENNLWSLAPNEHEPIPLSSDPQVSGAALCATVEGRIYFNRPRSEGLFYLDGGPQASAPYLGTSNGTLASDDMASAVGDFTPLRRDFILELLDSSSKIEVENCFSRNRFTLVISFLQLIYGSDFVNDLQKMIEETKYSINIIDAVISIIYGATSLDTILPFASPKERYNEEEIIMLAQVYSALSHLGFDSRLISDQIRFALDCVPTQQIDAFIAPILNPDVSAQPAAQFIKAISSSCVDGPIHTKEVSSHLLSRIKEVSSNLQCNENDTALGSNFKVSVSDVPEIYHVHDWVLVCRWTYLVRVLKAGMMEAQTRHLEFSSEVPACFVKPLLVYLYCGEISPLFSMSRCASFMLSDGDSLGFLDFEGNPTPVFSNLFAHCQQLIQSSMTPTNALVILEHRLKEGVEEEVRDAVEFCSRNLLGIADFEHQVQALERLPSDTIADIFFGTLSRLPERPFEIS